MDVTMQEDFTQEQEEEVKERDKTCVVSGETYETLLQAVPILPYLDHPRGAWTYENNNAILLSAVIESLFYQGVIWFTSTPQGVVLHITDDAELRSLMAKMHSIHHGQLLSRFPKECLFHLHLRNHCTLRTIGCVFAWRENGKKQSKEQLDALARVDLMDGPTLACFREWCQK